MRRLTLGLIFLTVLCASQSASAADAAALLLSHSNSMCENYDMTTGRQFLQRLQTVVGEDRLAKFAALSYTLCPSVGFGPEVSSVWYPDHGILSYVGGFQPYDSADAVTPVIQAIVVNGRGPLQPQAFDKQGHVVDNFPMPTIFTKCPRGTPACFGE